MSFGKNKTAAVVVLYNPDNEVVENILSYSSEVEYVYIVDNSSEINDAIKQIDNVKYFPMYKNLGLCKALNIGCCEAIKDGMEILVTFNQDTVCPNGTVTKLLHMVEKNPLSIYGTNFKFIYRNGTKRVFSDEVAFENKDSAVDWVITAGNAFSADAYNAVGGYMDELFVDNLDRDFCYKLKRAGYSIIRLGETYIYQEPGKTEIVSVGKKIIHVPNLSIIRYYLIFRNELFLRKKYGNEYNNYKVNLLKYVISIVFFEKGTIAKLRACIQGAKDGVNEKMQVETSQLIHYLS